MLSCSKLGNKKYIIFTTICETFPHQDSSIEYHLRNGIICEIIYITNQAKSATILETNVEKRITKANTTNNFIYTKINARILHSRISCDIILYPKDIKTYTANNISRYNQSTIANQKNFHTTNVFTE